MIELLKEVILDAQAAPLFKGIQRNLKIGFVDNKATIIIGVRRCGKSTFANQIAQQRMLEGVERENILYINFFDDRLSSLKELGLDLVIQAYFLLYPHKKNVEKIYCFFDEIQVITGWEAFVERLIRTENCQICIIGSSANMLSKEIATQMRGRALSWELFPFSFTEFTGHFGLENKPPFNSRQRLMLENAFEKYLENGGFPEVAESEKAIRIKIHQEYFNTILFRDLIERYDISHPRALVDLAKKLLENTASLYTINSLTNFLKSHGHSVHKSMVSDYMKWFEDAYFLFSVRLFDASYHRSNVNPKKIYAIDHAFVRSLSSGILVNSGHLLENIVFLALRRDNQKVFYYKTNTNQEIDFLVKKDDGSILLFQVSETLANQATRQRELSAIELAMKELNVSKSIVVAKNEDEVLEMDYGRIDIVPAWKFLINSDV
jgi:uncharacterized protein